MEKRQFDEFWEIRCPKCKQPIDLEILVNLLGKKLEKAKKP
jgi:phage FluMu protein Com